MLTQSEINSERTAEAIKRENYLYSKNQILKEITYMRLFFSYSHQDSNKVREIAHILSAAGHEAWYDADLLPGENWQKQLNDAIASFDAFIFVVSKNSLQSAWVKREFDIAQKLEKPIIPILLDKIELPLHLAQYQYVDFSQGITSQGIAKFVAGISFISSRQEPQEILKDPPPQDIYLEVIPSTSTVYSPTIEVEKKSNKPSEEKRVVDELNSQSVFISYKRDDWKEFVNPLIDVLKNAGLSVWVDQHLLEGGQDWLDEINKALKMCGKMVLCVSPEALESIYVKMEYRFFFHKRKQIIPLICRESELPAELFGIQSIPYTQLDDLLDRLKKI